MKEFLEILKLHQAYPEKLVEQAVKQALNCGAAHLDGGSKVGDFSELIYNLLADKL